jgi:hypothetical protein
LNIDADFEVEHIFAQPPFAMAPVCPARICPAHCLPCSLFALPPVCPVTQFALCNNSIISLPGDENLFYLAGLL